MKIVENKAKDFLYANFTESEPRWSKDAKYNYADEIRDGHYMYKYAGENNTNTTDSPSIDSIKQAPKWVNIRPTNYYAMLDEKTLTQTSVRDKIIVELNDLAYDTLSLMELNANNVKIELIDIQDNSNILYSSEKSLRDESEVIDFYTYCYAPIKIISTFYTGDIPIYRGAKLRVTIENQGNFAKCGRLIFGDSFFIGCTNIDISLGFESYSKKETDIFGNTTLLHRDMAVRDTYSITISSENIPMLRRKFRGWDAKSLLFIADENQKSRLENLLNFGYFEDVSFKYDGSDISTLNLTIRGIL